MPNKSIKYRRYPVLTQPQIQFIKPEQLLVRDISAFDIVKSEADTSTGVVASKSSVWLTSFIRPKEKDFTYEEFLNQRETEFIELLMQEDFSDSIRNESTFYISKLRRGGRYKNEVNLWMEKLYLTHQDNITFLLQLFRLMRCFSFGYFYPSSLSLANMGVHHVSDYVKSEALSLLDHWGNVEVFDLMNYHEPPETPWLRAKYITIRDSLERYAAIQKDRRNAVVG